MSLATLTTLERRVEQLENENRALDDKLRISKGLPPRAQEHDEILARIDARHAEQETPAAAFVRQQLEKQKNESQQWLSFCGVPAESDGDLCDFVLTLRGFCNEHACKAMLRLSLATAGKGCEADPTYPEVVESWPKIKADARAALQAMASAFVNKVLIES